MDLLEQEVYAIDSPIWNPNFVNTSFPKKVLGTYAVYFSYIPTYVNNIC